MNLHNQRGLLLSFMESFLIYIAVSDKLNEPSIQRSDVQVCASPECTALRLASKNVADVPSQSTTMFVKPSWIFSETLWIDAVAFTQPYESVGRMRPWLMFLEGSLIQVVLPLTEGACVVPTFIPTEVVNFRLCLKIKQGKIHTNSARMQHE